MVVHPLPDVSGLSVGILGGTGDQGRGLAYRLTRAGHAVRVGSRSAARGQAAAAELAALPGAGEVTGGGHPYPRGAHLLVLAVPPDGGAELVTSLRPGLSGPAGVDSVHPPGVDQHRPDPS